MFCRICLLVVAMLFRGGQTQVCPTGFIYFPNENKCYRVFPDRVTWIDAFHICFQHGSHLATVKDADSTAALRTMIAQSRGKCPNLGLWTAGRRYCTKCPFQWVTGCANLWPIGYKNWRKDKPNNYGRNEDCIEIVDDGGWNNVGCAEYRCPICEFDKSLI